MAMGRTYSWVVGIEKAIVARWEKSSPFVGFMASSLPATRWLPTVLAVGGCCTVVVIILSSIL
jgi:hypothetical protein